MSTEGDSRGTDADEDAVERARGYDEPATVDLLDRRPLARSIADCVANTPREYGVRAGLFGEWGSGKSSVLRFVRQILEARGHTVVEFSPWGIGDPSELWARFGQRLLEQLKEKGKKEPGSIFGRLAIKHQDWISTGFEIVKGFADRVSPVGGVAPAMDAVRKLLNRTQKQVQALAEGEERIVVMIDDVDRTDPKLVPPILFALRELLDFPRFSWILAIDPVVVRAALTQHHPGFALGRDYLEKVVDFPFILRGPAPDVRVALVEHDLGEHRVIADARDVREISELLPENPRELRAIVRNLLSIKPTIARLGPEDDLDHRLLLALVVIHTASPGLLLKLLESKKVLRQITGLGLAREKKEEQTARKVIKEFLSEAATREHDRPRLEGLLIHLGKGALWARETVAKTADLIYTSPVMTAREAAQGLAVAPDARTLDGWLAGFAKQQDRTQPEVRKAFFEQLLATHDRAMNQAIGSYGEDGVRAAVTRVEEVIRRVEILLFDLNAVADFGPDELGKLRSAVSQWAHFIAPPEYLPARQAERQVLLRFANADKLDPMEALSRLAPRRLLDDEVANPGEAARRRLNLDLIGALEKRAAKTVVELFDRQDLAASLPREAASFLVRRDGFLWSFDFRHELTEALGRDRSPARSENARELLKAALECFLETAGTLTKRPDLMELLWNAATVVAPNMRMFESLQRLRADAERLAGMKLAEPSWWEAKKAQYLAATEKGKEAAA